MAKRINNRPVLPGIAGITHVTKGRRPVTTIRVFVFSVYIAGALVFQEITQDLALQWHRISEFAEKRGWTLQGGKILSCGQVIGNLTVEDLS